MVPVEVVPFVSGGAAGTVSAEWRPEMEFLTSHEQFRLLTSFSRPPGYRLPPRPVSRR